MAMFLPEPFYYPEDLWYCMKVGSQLRAWREDPGSCPCLSTGEFDQITGLRGYLIPYESHWYFINLGDSMHLGLTLEGTPVWKCSREV